jgi:hypothetical protein
MAPGMEPLDAGAVSMKSGSAYSGEVLQTTITGADSIDG